MRDFVQRLRASAGLLEPSLVSGSVLVLTSLVFFRSALLPEFGAELEMSTFELGIVTTVFGIGRLVADLPGGYLADRIVATRLLAVAAAGVAVGSLALGLAGSALPVYLAIFLLGLASATTNGTGMTYYSNVGGPGFRGTAMAVFSASLLGGQAIGPAVGGLIASVADWRLAMYVAAGVASVLAIGLVFGTRAHQP
ncbi:MAG: MFS transporter, partial [Acidimicrobiia bacterium]|nr:MFS transporter [Acidimicrobiia bacterium]